MPTHCSGLSRFWIWNRWQCKGDISTDEILSGFYAQLFHEVMRDLISIGTKRRQHCSLTDEEPAPSMIDRSGADRHEDHARAGQSGRQRPTQYCKRPAKGVLVEVIQYARTRHNDEIELRSKQKRATETNCSSGKNAASLCWLPGAASWMDRAGRPDEPKDRMSAQRYRVWSRCRQAGRRQLRFPQELQHGFQRTVIAGIAGTKLPEKSYSLSPAAPTSLGQTDLQENWQKGRLPFIVGWGGLMAEMRGRAISIHWPAVYPLPPDIPE